MPMNARQMLASLPVRRFAEGGDVTDAQIRDFLAANAGASDAQIAQVMNQYGVTPARLAAAAGYDPQEVTRRYEAALPLITPTAPPAATTQWQPGESIGRQRAIESGNETNWLAQVKASADAYMARATPATAAEAYDAMVQSGIGIKDLLDAGVSQMTIDKALSIETDAEQKAVNTLTQRALTNTLAQNPNVAPQLATRGAQDVYAQSRQFVENLQKDGLTDDERRYLQQVAAQQGWGYSDIRAAGVDPSILFKSFEAPAPVTPAPVTPAPVTPTPVTPTPTPVFPQPEPYTPVTVYDPEKFIRENAGADLYKKGEIALDTAFRESAPRTAIPGMPGAYEYTPAAKLRPATGAGYSWTPPVVTSRPRSLLSPTLLSYVSPSQQFAQSRASQDQALLSAFRQSGLPQNASNFYSWRNRLRSGEFGAGAAFDPAAFQSAFGSWAATQAPGTTAQGAAPVGGVTGYSEIAGGIQPIDPRTLPTFADGGEATSARGMLERLKKPDGTGEDVPGAVDQGPRNLPLERMNARRARAGMGEYVPQTESRSMLERLQRFTSLDQPQDMSLGETVADIGMGFLPGVGTAQGARDFERSRREGDTLGMVLGAASMIPIVGGAVRAARRAANVAEAVPGAARQMLDAVPQASTPRVPAVGTPVRFVNLRQAGASRDELRQVERDFKSYQSGVQSVDELVSTATRVDPVFQGSVRDVADSIGGSYIPGPPKTAESITKKLTRKGGTATAADVADSIRATVLVENNAQAEEAVRQIASRYPTIDEGWQRIPSNGYIDRKLGVQFTGPNGERLLGEVQINTLPMQTAKDKEGHKLYKIEQSLIEKYGAPEKMPDEELMRYRDAVHEQSRIYGEAETRVDSSILEQLVEKRARGGYIGRLGRP